MTSGGIGASGAVIFSYTLATPALYAISPSSGPLAGGTLVTIVGAGFYSVTAVYFGVIPCTSYTVASSSVIYAYAPAGSGTQNIVVYTIGGNTGAYGPFPFTYIPIPTVTGISPSVGPSRGGGSINITGSSFTSATAVHFGNLSAGFTVANDGLIGASAPAQSAGTVYVSVTNASGNSLASVTYTYQGPVAPTASGRTHLRR